MYFEKPEIQKKWMKHLQKATGSYNIKDYYQFSKKNKTKCVLQKKNSFEDLSDDEKPPIMKIKKYNDMLEQLDDADITIGEDHERPIIKEIIVGEHLIDNVIGQGSSGSIICKGIHKDSHQEVAIKIIEKKRWNHGQLEDIRDSINIFSVS